MDRTATWWQKTAVVLKNKNINILHYKVFSRVEEICAAFKQRLLDEKKKTSAISFYEQMSVAIFTLHLRRKKKDTCASPSPQYPCMTNRCVRWLTQYRPRILRVESYAGPLNYPSCALRPQFGTIRRRCGEAHPRAQTACHCKIPFILRKNTGEAVGIERLFRYQGGIASRQQKNVTQCWYKKIEGSQKTKLKPPYEKGRQLRASHSEKGFL